MKHALLVGLLIVLSGCDIDGATFLVTTKPTTEVIHREMEHAHCYTAHRATTVVSISCIPKN